MCPPTRPDTDDKLTIEPPCLRSSGIAYLQPRKVPSRLTDEHAPPGGEVELLDVAERDDAGGIDQPVEPAVLALDVGGDALPVGLRGHVERRVDAGAARSLAIAVPPARFHRGRHGAADGAAGAGDEDDLVVEIGHSSDISP